MKIFVTGFQRSGTTLLKDLIGKHPDVKMMWHETGLLKHDKKYLYRAKKLPYKTTRSEREKNKSLPRSKKIEIDFDMRNDNWGEKIPYRNMVIKKGVHLPIHVYCQKWNEYFLPDAAIVHIIRHPIDMGLSTKKIGYSKGIVRPIEELKKVFPRVMMNFREFKNLIHVKYEDLVLKPDKSLKRIFNFCNLDSSDETIGVVLDSDIHSFGSINKNRAFNFKKQNINTERLNIQEVIRRMNKVKGVKYDY